MIQDQSYELQRVHMATTSPYITLCKFKRIFLSQCFLSPPRGCAGGLDKVSDLICLLGSHAGYTAQHATYAIKGAEGAG